MDHNNPLLLPSMILVASILASLQSVDPSLIQQVEAQLQKAPIERLASAEYHTRVLGVIEADLDRDGTAERIAWLQPSLRQTPTVLVFRRQRDTGGWLRIQEALAPGRLTSVTGQLRDLHTLGVGVDMTAGDGSDASTNTNFAASAASGLSFVAYAGFLHADQRAGATFVVDLRAWQLPTAGTTTCEAFEFSPVRQVAYGRIGATSDAVLVALTPNDITLYQIDSISVQGRLSAHAKIRPRPAGTLAIVQDRSGALVLTTSGGTVPIPQR